MISRCDLDPVEKVGDYCLFMKVLDAKENKTME